MSVFFFLLSHIRKLKTLKGTEASLFFILVSLIFIFMISTLVHLRHFNLKTKDNVFVDFVEIYECKSLKIFCKIRLPQFLSSSLQTTFSWTQTSVRGNFNFLDENFQIRSLSALCRIPQTRFRQILTSTVFEERVSNFHIKNQFENQESGIISSSEAISSFLLLFFISQFSSILETRYTVSKVRHLLLPKIESHF